MDAEPVDQIRQGIVEKYRKVAVSPAGLFRYPTGAESARALGYPLNLVAGIPPAVQGHFVGVGNPFALGPIAPGEDVLDLGCGTGFDALVAAQLVGPGGRVIGIDLSPEMLALAKAGRAGTGFGRAGFAEAQVEALPFPDAAFDVVLSNGVLNLVPDKPSAVREIFRVLRTAGRLQACDIGLVGDEPPPDKAAWSDWIAGAVARKVFLAMLKEAGFTEVRCAGTGTYHTSAHTQATFYTARKSPTQ